MRRAPPLLLRGAWGPSLSLLEARPAGPGAPTALSLPHSELLKITSPSSSSSGALGALISYANVGQAGGVTTVRAGALRVASGRCLPGMERSRGEHSALESGDPPGAPSPGGWCWFEEALKVSRADTSVLTKCPRRSQTGSRGAAPLGCAARAYSSGQHPSCTVGTGSLCSLC